MCVIFLILKLKVAIASCMGMGTLPVVLNFVEDMTAGELVQNWHKCCFVKFSKEKLQRATKKRDGRMPQRVTTLLQMGLDDSQLTPVCFVNKMMDTYSTWS